MLCLEVLLGTPAGSLRCPVARPLNRFASAGIGPLEFANPQMPAINRSPMPAEPNGEPATLSIERNGPAIELRSRSALGGSLGVMSSGIPGATACCCGC